MALRFLVGRVKPITFGHLKTKIGFLGPIGQNLCKFSTSNRHNSSTHTKAGQNRGIIDEFLEKIYFDADDPCDGVRSSEETKHDCIESLAQFAVNKHNERQNAHLQLMRVLEASDERVPHELFTVEWEETPYRETMSSGWVESLKMCGIHGVKPNMRVVKEKKEYIYSLLHFITLEALNDGEQKIYRAVVEVETWRDYFIKLLDLKPVDDNISTVVIKEVNVLTKAGLGAMVRLLRCDLEVTGSSHGNSVSVCGAHEESKEDQQCHGRNMELPSV